MGSVQVGTTVSSSPLYCSCRRSGSSTYPQPTTTPGTSAARHAIAAIGGGMAIALFSYLGVETASVAAAKVRDPDRNIPRATILGTLATASSTCCHWWRSSASCRALPGGVVATFLRCGTNAMFGGIWPGDAMAVAVIISGLGALNGWTMICAEMPLAAANDGLFPGKAGSSRLSSKGVPAYGIIASTVLASIAIVDQRHGHERATLYSRPLILMSGITAAMPIWFLGASSGEVALGGPQDGADAAFRYEI